LKNKKPFGNLLQQRLWQTLNTITGVALVVKDVKPIAGKIASVKGFVKNALEPEKSMHILQQKNLWLGIDDMNQTYRHRRLHSHFTIDYRNDQNPIPSDGAVTSEKYLFQHKTQILDRQAYDRWRP